MLTIRAAAASLAVAITTLSGHAQTLDAQTRAKGNVVADRAIAFLMSQQDPQTGGFAVDPRPDAFQYPAITGLVMQGVADDDGFDPDDPRVQRAVDFMLSFAQPDGGIYDRVLASYNTAICMSALARIDRERYDREYLQPGVRFLRTLQWSEDAADRDDTGVVDRDHPFYGGVGYGRNNRPDNSNLNLTLQALHDAGVPETDPAFQRALVFLQRTQMVDAINDMDYADGSNQGGFIYATSPDGTQLGVGESKAGTIDESLSGATVSRLRAYGSMTYAGFKSFAYAGLSEDDPRVTAALKWLQRNYTMDENPGIGTDGQYYYYMTLGRALAAWGEAQLSPRTPRTEDEIVRATFSFTATLDQVNADNLVVPITTATLDDGSIIRFDEAPLAFSSDRVSISNGSPFGGLRLESQTGFPDTTDGRVVDEWNKTEVRSGTQMATPNGPVTSVTFEETYELRLVETSRWIGCTFDVQVPLDSNSVGSAPLDRCTTDDGRVLVFDPPLTDVTVMGRSTTVALNADRPDTLADGTMLLGLRLDPDPQRTTTSLYSDDAAEVQVRILVDIPRSIDWRADLINKLADLQNPDGSFRVLDDRWMESNPVLITAYALIALQEALNLPEGP